MSENRVFGLIGKNLTHSWSQRYFKNMFEVFGLSNCRYNHFAIGDVAQIRDILRENPALEGFNVTIPYKISIIPYLDTLDPEAAAVGAINTVKRKGNKLIGYNTDIYGFRISLIRFVDLSDVKAALVLGTGGASSAVQYVLRDLGIPYQLVSRTKTETSILYEEIDRTFMAQCNLIINTSPVGMFPNVNACPDIPYEWINNTFYLFDLVYNPEKSLFLAHGESKGAKVKNGLEMLELQAQKAWHIWTT